MGIYADAVLKERTVYAKRKVNLCVKIAHALTKLRAISALGRHRQGWLHGHVTCAVSQGPLLRRAHTFFMLCCHSVEILIKLWTRGTSFPFHTGPHTLSSWVQIRSYGAWNRVKSPPAERNKKYFQKEETYELCLKKEQDWKREICGEVTVGGGIWAKGLVQSKEWRWERVEWQVAYCDWNIKCWAHGRHSVNFCWMHVRLMSVLESNGLYRQPMREKQWSHCIEL